VRFEVRDRDVAGRIGRFDTGGPVVTTPELMPVINPHEPTVDPKDIERIGFEAVITNAYIVWKDEDLRERAIDEGIHSVVGFDGFVMTDSGSFQLAEYGDVEVDNRTIVEFQAEIGSDVGTILDIPTPPDAPREVAERDVKTTVERAKEAVECEERPPLALTVQGSTYPDLREKCAAELGELPAAVHPIGGVVPLLEDYRFADVVDVVMAAKKALPPEKPVHLFGCGHPLAIPLAVAMGCDLFDSASYALYAKTGRYLSVLGTLRLEEMRWFPCRCPVCSRYDPQDLREMPEEERVELLALHNLNELRRVIDTVRCAISGGELWELVEATCRSHPAAWAGLVRLSSRYGDELARWSPSVKRSLKVYDEVSKGRPELHIYRDRMRGRFGGVEGRRIVKAGRRPYDVEWLESWELAFVDEWLGLVPGELTRTFPCHSLVEPSEFERRRDDGEDRRSGGRRGDEGRRR